MRTRPLSAPGYSLEFSVTALADGTKLAIDALHAHDVADMHCALSFLNDALCAELPVNEDERRIRITQQQLLCAQLRHSGGIERLCTLMEHGSACHSAMLVLGNACSVSVDPEAESSREILRSCGGFQTILDHMWSDSDPDVVRCAAGACMNICSTLDDALSLQRSGLLPRLTAFSLGADVQLAQFASGCLQNMQAAITHEVVSRMYVSTLHTSAAVAAQAVIRGFLARCLVKRALASGDLSLLVETESLLCSRSQELAHNSSYSTSGSVAPSSKHQLAATYLASTCVTPLPASPSPGRLMKMTREAARIYEAEAGEKLVRQAELAATVMQRSVRGHLVRCAIAARLVHDKQAAEERRAHWRAQRAARDATRTAERSAQALQCAARCLRARGVLKQHRMQLEVESAARRDLGQRVARNVAATQLQCAMRMAHAGRVLEVRRHGQRMQLEATRKLGVEVARGLAAVRVQCAARAMLAQHALAEARARHHTRSMVERDATRKLGVEVARGLAAVRVQCAARAAKARRVAVAARKEHTAYAVAHQELILQRLALRTLQAASRSMLARAAAGRLREQARNQRDIDAAARRCIALDVIRSLAAVRLQCAMRCFAARSARERALACRSDMITYAQDRSGLQAAVRAVPVVLSGTSEAPAPAVRVSTDSIEMAAAAQATSVAEVPAVSVSDSHVMSSFSTSGNVRTVITTTTTTIEGTGTAGALATQAILEVPKLRARLDDALQAQQELTAALGQEKAKIADTEWALSALEEERIKTRALESALLELRLSFEGLSDSSARATALAPKKETGLLLRSADTVAARPANVAAPSDDGLATVEDGVGEGSAGATALAPKKETGLLLRSADTVAARPANEAAKHSAEYVGAEASPVSVGANTRPEEAGLLSPRSLREARLKHFDGCTDEACDIAVEVINTKAGGERCRLDVLDFSSAQHEPGTREHQEDEVEHACSLPSWNGLCTAGNM